MLVSSLGMPCRFSFCSYGSSCPNKWGIIHVGVLHVGGRPAGARHGQSRACGNPETFLVVGCHLRPGGWRATCTPHLPSQDQTRLPQACRSPKRGCILGRGLRDVSSQNPWEEREGEPPMSLRCVLEGSECYVWACSLSDAILTIKYFRL